MNYALIAQQTKNKELKSKGKIVTPQFRCREAIVDDMTPLQRLKAKRNCDSQQGVHHWPQIAKPRAYNGCMTYEITCPALGETETTTDLDRAMDICFAMHDESDSYAYIRDSFGDIVGEYGDVMEALVDQLI